MDATTLNKSTCDQIYILNQSIESHETQIKTLKTDNVNLQNDCDLIESKYTQSKDDIDNLKNQNKLLIHSITD